MRNKTFILALAAALDKDLCRRLAADADSLTYFETAGPGGVVGFPVSDVFARLADLSGAEVDLCRCAGPVEAIRLTAGGRSVTLVANCSARPLRVPVRDEAGAPVEELALDPYAVGRVDGGGPGR